MSFSDTESDICFRSSSHLLHTLSRGDMNLMCGQHLSHMSLKLLCPTHLTESELCEQAWLYNLNKDTLLSADGNKIGGSLALVLGATGCGDPFFCPN